MHPASFAQLRFTLKTYSYNLYINYELHKLKVLVVTLYAQFNQLLLPSRVPL